MDGLRISYLLRGCPTVRLKALADRPSIAVLPFTNLSNDAEQDFFVDGITEDLMTALSRIRQFFVIARNATLRYKREPPDLREIAATLGVRYVVEGSVRRDAGRVRVSAQLLDGLLAIILGGAFRPQARRYICRSKTRSLAKSQDRSSRSSAAPNTTGPKLRRRKTSALGSCSIAEWR